MASNSIYDEAIIEAKKLREVAEANARNVLIEAWTPRIRELIEQQLLGEMPMPADGEDVLTDVPHDLEDPMTEPGEEIILDLDLLQGAAEGPHDPGVENLGDDEFLLSRESVEALLALSEGQSVTSPNALVERVTRVRKGLSFAQDLAESSASNERNGKVLLAQLLSKMLSESKTLQNEVIRIGGEDLPRPLASLNEEIQKVLKEIVEMASRKQLIKEGSEMFEIDLAELDLPECDYMSEDDEELDVDMDDEEVADDMGDEMGDELDVDDQDQQPAEIPADLAQELIAALEGQVGDEDLDDDMDVDMDMEDGEELDGEELDDVVEIDEGMLRRELARMRANLAEGDGATDPDVLKDFGGASVDKEVFVDGEDSDLNVHAEVRNLRAKLKNESRVNRALSKQLRGFKRVHADLREQLEQMNLFNAKLLYVNKLMNKESMSTRQKKSVVEALDKAQTLREVRLLYKTLSESLSRGRKKGSMNESARRAGSASRASRSGSANSSGGQPDRWAVLAGIPLDSK